MWRCSNARRRSTSRSPRSSPGPWPSRPLKPKPGLMTRILIPARTCLRLATMADRELAEQPVVQTELSVLASEQMRALGAQLAEVLLPGDLVVLDGPLGAGKTTLVQGIGTGLGVRGPVTSPTFVIARLHPSLRGGPDLVHADAYRLGSWLEVDDLDLDADVDHCVTVVEWGE